MSNRISIRVLTTIAVAFVTSSLLAQTWQLPERGAAFYERKREDSARGGAGIQGMGGAAGGYQAVEMPPILFHGDLDDKLQYPVQTPGDLREIPSYLAFDLRKANSRGKLKLTINTLYQAAPVTLTGKIGDLDRDGYQTINVQMEGKSGDAMQCSISGRITIKRKVDFAKGIVSEFESEITADIKYPTPGRGMGPIGGDSGPASVTVKDKWSFLRFEENRGGNFEEEVAKTIEDGAKYILSLLGRGGRGFDPNGGGGGQGMPGMEVDWQGGTLALQLLTVVKAGIPTTNKVLQAGFDRLRRREMKDTYSVSLAMMALESLYAPVNEREHLITGRLQKPPQRKLSAEDFALMKEWTQIILSNRDSTKSEDSVLRFHYNSGSPRYDNSNSQYALLGLYSAYLCGVPIKDSVWQACARHWLDDLQSDDSQTVKLETTNHSVYRKMREQAKRARRAAASGAGTGRTSVTPRTRRTRSSRRVKGSGWPYVSLGGTRAGPGMGAPMTPAVRATGSMTTAGLTALAICDAVLRSKKKGGRMRGALGKASDAGLAWMLDNFSVRDNRFSHGWYWYYLYGLERAFELHHIALLGNRDWYYEGSTILLALRSRSGRRGGRGIPGNGGMGFGDFGGIFRGATLYQTCFGILFLKQAAPPLPVVTGSGGR